MSFLSEADWAEKYRPRKLSDVVLAPKYRKLFDSYVKSKQFPHLLFYGNVGSGKTTVGLILTKALSATVLELNASDERGIGVVRAAIKSFVYHKATGLKVVFLDEADGLTSEAQEALRRLMEKGAGNARFLLTANHIHRITAPLLSRCTALEFGPPGEEYVVEYLMKILSAEKIKHDEEEVLQIVVDCYPDIRKCVRTLQLNCHQQKLAYTFFQRKAGGMDVDELFKLIKKQDVSYLRKHIVNSAVYYDTAFETLLDHLLKDKDFSKVKADAALIIAEYAYRNSIVIDRDLNFVACCIDVGRLLEE